MAVTHSTRVLNALHKPAILHLDFRVVQYILLFPGHAMHLLRYWLSVHNLRQIR
jgi:hypothetical protein